MAKQNSAEAEFQNGLQCIVTSVKSSDEVNLRFVIEKTQYTVSYVDRKFRYRDRNFQSLLRGSEAVKASIWNIPFGPPGSNKRSWYVTDIWTPNVNGMQKKRLPEPTMAIVCRIAYDLGKEFVVCEVGRCFAQDVIILPRSIIQSVKSNEKLRPEIGNYILVFALVIWEDQENDDKARLVPIWAHWDEHNCSPASVVHLNSIESGPENNKLIISEPWPCMWGVVENVFKKSLKVFVPTICVSVSVPNTSIYQNSSNINEGDWVQLWLMPKPKGPMFNHLSDVDQWVCVSCCWLGTKAKKIYDSYLDQRLKPERRKQGQSVAGATKAQSKNSKPETNTDVKKLSTEVTVGIGKVIEIKERSGILSAQNFQYVFHLGMMTVYGVPLSKIKNLKVKDVVKIGSEVRYKMNLKSNSLKSVWIGPEVVTFKHLNFLTQLTEWMKSVPVDGRIIQEMMKYIMLCHEKVRTSPDKKETVSKKETKEKQNKKTENLSRNSNFPSQNSLNSIEEASSSTGKPSSSFTFNLTESEVSGMMDISSCPTYSKEEEEELEKLWWSEDSEESDDELRPIFKPQEDPTLPDSDDKGNKEGSVVSEGSSNQEWLCEAPKPFPRNKREEKKTSSSTSSSGILTKKENLQDSESALAAFLAGPSPTFKQQSEEEAVGKTDVVPTSKEETASEKIKDGLNVGSASKINTDKNPPTLLILMELTKFLLKKGKANSIAEAGEISAEFVAQIECAMLSEPEITQPRRSTTEASVQTEISGPVLAIINHDEEHKELPETLKDSLNLVD